MHAQEVETREQAPTDGSDDVARVEESHPGDSLTRRLHVARDGWECGAHQDRRGEQHQRTQRGPNEHVRHARRRQARVYPVHAGEEQKNQKAPGGHGPFEGRVHLQRGPASRPDAGQEQAPNEHSAHERPEQKPQGYPRRADDELEHLEPDDLVDQRRGPASDEEEGESGQVPRERTGRSRVCHRDGPRGRMGGESAPL